MDRIDFGSRRRLHELTRIGIERFEIATLSLVEQDVERERGFAGARNSGDHREAVARDLDVDVLQVVLARPAHDDTVAITARGERPRLRYTGR